MNRSGYLAGVIFSVLVFVAGCSLSPNPKEVLSKYLDNYFHGNYDKAYELLSSKDKAVKNRKEFSRDSEEFVGIEKAFGGKISFNIKEVRITGEKAQGTVDVTKPDLNGAIGEFLGAAMKSILNGGKTFEKETEKIITEKTKNGNLPTITTTEQYDLVKDKDGWRVHMGLENEKIIKELKSVAEKLEKQKKFVEAKAKYTEIQGLS